MFMKRLRRLLLAGICGTALGCGNGRHVSGDRVLVSKCAYESGLTAPRRFDVVVFKYPQEPIRRGSPYNYIKRLMGLPGDLLAILFGRLYVCPPGEVVYQEKDENGKPIPAKDL